MTDYEARTPFVTVIIPVHNDAMRLRNCLSALMNQTWPESRFEVVVVDNGSDEAPTATIDEFPQTRVLVETRSGSYAARNTGVSAARGEILAFTDADCRPTRDWLQRGVDGLYAKKAGIVAGRIKLSVEDPTRPTLAEVYEHLFAFRQDHYVSRRFGATANLFVRREVLADVGYFDPRLKSSGDVEWGIRATRAGHSIAYVSDAVVLHPARRQTRELLRKAIRVAGGLHMLDVIGGRPIWIRVWNALWALRPPLRLILRTVREPLPGNRSRLGVVGIILLVRLAFGTERLRLLIGGRPAR